MKPAAVPEAKRCRAVSIMVRKRCRETGTLREHSRDRVLLLCWVHHAAAEWREVQMYGGTTC